MARKKLDSPRKVRTTLDELEVLMRLKETTEWAIVKRISERYIRNLKSASFKLMETDAHYLAVRHAEFAGQALGIKMLIRMVEESGKRLEKRSNKK